MLRDDAAVLTPPVAHSLVITTDSVIEGVHVLRGCAPARLAEKLLRRALSDLAAMGATPWRYSLNLHTPVGCRDDWFAAFASSLAAQQNDFGLSLIGGDSTCGAPGEAVHASVTLFGLLPASAKPMQRRGAQPGDHLYVSGTLGDAAAGLFLLQHFASPPAEFAALIARYHCPNPRLALGEALRGLATAAVDLSDGLLSDLQHLCEASGVGAQIAQAAIPHSEAFTRFLAAHPAQHRLDLNGGDDYEILFTAPALAAQPLAQLAQTLALPLHRIGEITAAPGLVLRDQVGAVQELPNLRGWSHG